MEKNLLKNGNNSINSLRSESMFSEPIVATTGPQVVQESTEGAGLVWVESESIWDEEIRAKGAPEKPRKRYLGPSKESLEYYKWMKERSLSNWD